MCVVDARHFGSRSDSRQPLAHQIWSVLRQYSSSSFTVFTAKVLPPAPSSRTITCIDRIEKKSISNNNNNNNNSNMNQASVVDYGMIPLKYGLSKSWGGIRGDGMQPEEKKRFVSLMRKQYPKWCKVDQDAQDLYDQKDFVETERTVTTLLETIERYEEVCVKKVLSKATQKKLAGYKRLFWTLPEESCRKLRGVSRMNLGNYEGALQDFDMLLDMVSCTEEQPPSINDHKFAISILRWHVECRGEWMKQAAAALLNDGSSLSDTDSITTTNLDHLQRSIGDLLKEIFETAWTAGLFAWVEEESDWMELYVKYQVQKKVLQAVLSNKVLERPFFTAEERRDLEIDMGKCLFAKGCSYSCSHCGATGIVSNTNNNNNSSSNRAAGADDGRVTMEQLHLCTGCRRSWFCNRHCQKNAWKDHKVFCGKCTQPWLLSDEIKTDFEAAMSTLASASLSPPPPHNNGGAATVFALKVKDELRVCGRDACNGGRFFDTISNQDVYFMPSERAAVDEIADKLGIEVRFLNED